MSLVRKNNPWLFVGLLLACFFVSAGARYHQFETWKKNPEAFFVGERPMMTTLDAPYWLRWAREYNQGSFRQWGELRGYPRSTKNFRERYIPQKFRRLPHTSYDPISSSQSSSHMGMGTGYRDVPLLSFLIAHLAPFFNYNYYLTGTLLVPVLASLFILPLGIYFFMIGLPIAGLLGGLIATFANGYYMRTSIGRIDTDLLNTFFPLLVGLLIFLASRAKTERSVLLFSMGTGLSLFLFQWWYMKEGFLIAYFCIAVISLFIQKFRFRTILLSALLIVLCAYPMSFLTGVGSILGFFKGYFVVEEAATTVMLNNDSKVATFPNTMTTISEVGIIPMNQVFHRILSNTILCWIGFLAFIGMAVFRWKLFLPLIPMLALGLMSFQSSNRFIMYLAPFIGIGLGWLLNLGIGAIFLLITNNFVHREVKTKLKSRKIKKERIKDKFSFLYAPETAFFGWIRQVIIYMGLGVFFWLIYPQTSISFVPRPSIDPRLYVTFLEVKKRVPEGSALLTWWDYGYAITDVTGLATFHDGGGQTTPMTYFFARSLISPDADELYDITQYLATENNLGIAKNNTSPEDLLQAVRNPIHKPWDPIYLFFTADMTGKYGAISKLGSWDIVKGGSKPRGYQILNCNKITNEEMNCRGAKIDLKAGKINNQVALKRMVFIRDGQVLREQKFGHAQGYTLQMLVVGQRIVEVQLIDEAVFQSNYNQMFLLGRFDGELFEETYNAFPFSRLYKVKF